MTGLTLEIGEDGIARKRKEPYIVIEVETEEDYVFLQEAIEFYAEHKEKQKEN